MFGIELRVLNALIAGYSSHSASFDVILLLADLYVEASKPSRGCKWHSLPYLSLVLCSKFSALTVSVMKELSNEQGSNSLSCKVPIGSISPSVLDTSKYQSMSSGACAILYPGKPYSS